MKNTTSSIPQKELLTAALIGLISQGEMIQGRISAIQALLAGDRPRRQVRRARVAKPKPELIRAVPEKPRQRRTMSAKARASIAKAQRARWAAFHRQRNKQRRAA